MIFAINLNSRQTARTLEQAARHHAEVTLSPLVREDDTVIRCRLEAIADSRAAKRPCLVLSPWVDNDIESDNESDPVIDTDIQAYADLIGTYCEVTIHLGENRYLYSGDVVGINDHSGENRNVTLFLAKPDLLQVAQRRKYWRFKPAQSSQVQLDWSGPDGVTDSGVGWLCNVSADGLACRTTTQVADQIGIGETVVVSFVLGPGEPEFFRLDGVLCNKTPAGSKNTVILGMQFAIGKGHSDSDENATRLRTHLLSVHSTPAKSPEGERS